MSINASVTVIVTTGGDQVVYTLDTVKDIQVDTGYDTDGGVFDAAFRLKTWPVRVGDECMNVTRMPSEKRAKA